MGASLSAERRREKKILWGILLVSLLVLLRLWDYFGVISLPGILGDAFWRNQEWSSVEEGKRVEEIQRWLQKEDPPARPTR